ncbi:MAG: hypothetical protein AAFO07_10960 [Bacteroidota bacterium]
MNPSPEDIQKEVTHLILSGKTAEAIRYLLDSINSPALETVKNQILLISAKYQEYKKNSITGTLSPVELSAALGRINASIISLIEDLNAKEDEMPPPTIPLWKKVAMLGIGIGLLFVVCFLVINSYSLNKSPSKEPTDHSMDSLRFFVIVHGPGGRQDVILKNEGLVVADVNNQRLVAAIDSMGQATFKLYDPHKDGQIIQMSVLEAEVDLVHSDSNYLLDGTTIYLEVKPKKSEDKIESVRTPKNLPKEDSIIEVTFKTLSNITVTLSFNGKKTTATSDSIGNITFTDMPLEFKNQVVDLYIEYLDREKSPIREPYFQLHEFCFNLSNYE